MIDADALADFRNLRPVWRQGSIRFWAMLPEKWLLGVFLLAVLALFGCRDQSLDARTVTVILGAKLIDGTGGPSVEDSVVVVENGRIRAAGARAQVPVPKDSTRIDGAGKVIIPGLIDAHCHYFAPPEDVKKYLLVQLKWGITTTRSAGTDSPEAVALMHEAKQGKFLAPRVYTSGFGFTHPQGAPAVNASINRPANEKEARAAVRTLAAQEVDFIKLWVEGAGGRMPKIAPQIRAAIVDEARKHRIPIVAHVTAVEDLRQLAELGVTDFLHIPRDAAATAELIGYAKSKGLSFAPTLANMESGWHYYEHPKLLEVVRQRGRM